MKLNKLHIKILKYTILPRGSADMVKMTQLEPDAVSIICKAMVVDGLLKLADVDHRYIVRTEKGIKALIESEGQNEPEKVQETGEGNERDVEGTRDDRQGQAG